MFLGSRWFMSGFRRKDLRSLPPWLPAPITRSRSGQFRGSLCGADECASISSNPGHVHAFSMSRLKALLATLSESERAAAVDAFDARYGEMERALWCLSRHCRTALVERRPSPVLGELVWTVKSWWGVQGVRSETKAQMAEALLALEWSADAFEGPSMTPPEHASDLVGVLVARTQALGAPRREFSLASKVLHWLLPWRVPVYDAFVCRALRIPTSWDAAHAYRRVVREVYAAIPDVEAADRTWMGSVDPRSPLRAIDKWLWWVGGGNSDRAVVVRDPWRAVTRPGLDPH